MEMRNQFTLLNILNKLYHLEWTHILCLACHKAFGNFCDTLVILKITLYPVKNGIQGSCMYKCAFLFQLFFYDCNISLAAYQNDYAP